MENGFEVVNLHGSASGILPVPVIAENGNWFVGNKDTGVKAEGIDGKDGKDGVAGPQGPKGDTGGAGSKGDTGEAGPAGPQGPRGEKGDKGETGPQGPEGVTPKLAANLITTEEGKALDAVMGKVLNDRINEVDNKLTSTGGDSDMNLADKVDAIYNTVVTTAPEKIYFWTTSPVNIKSIYPDIYNRMANADFMAGTTGASGSFHVKDVGSSGAGASGSGNCFVSYNSGSGILTFGGFDASYQHASNETGRVYSSGTVFAIWKGTVGGTVQ